MSIPTWLFVQLTLKNLSNSLSREATAGRDIVRIFRSVLVKLNLVCSSLVYNLFWWSGVWRLRGDYVGDLRYPVSYKSSCYEEKKQLWIYVGTLIPLFDIKLKSKNLWQNIFYDVSQSANVSLLLINVSKKKNHSLVLATSFLLFSVKGLKEMWSDEQREAKKN